MRPIEQYCSAAKKALSTLTMTNAPNFLPAGAENISIGGFNLYAGPVWRLPAEGDIRRYALVVADKHMNGSGSLHGGVLMTFADIAMSQTARAASGARTCTTVALTCDFVGPGKLGDVIEARVRVTRQTRTMIFLSTDMLAGDRMLGVATGLWKVL
jgi:uncharacterized protein (TIGR00369 family)